MKNITFELNYNTVWRIVMTLAAISMIFTISNTSYGAASTEIVVIGPLMCKIAQGLTGGIARGIATIAIFSVGVGLFMGKFNWGTAALVAVGVALIFGAPKLVGFFSAASNSDCPTA